MFRKILIASLVLFAVAASFGQNANQNVTAWARTNFYDGPWVVHSGYAADDTLFYTRGDSVWSEIMLLWPWQDLQVTLADTTTASTDSTGLQVQLWQNQLYRPGSAATDSARFTYIGTLSFRGSGATLTATSITAEGTWSCNLTNDPVRPVKFWRLLFIGTSAGRVLDGNYAVITAAGWGK